MAAAPYCLFVWARLVGPPDGRQMPQARARFREYKRMLDNERTRDCDGPLYLMRWKQGIIRDSRRRRTRIGLSEQGLRL